jgi:hypothetical protein
MSGRIFNMACWLPFLFSGDGLEKFWPMVLEKVLADVRFLYVGGDM